ncbi:hypothetical protein ACIPIN_13925 [Pseudomonas sp. NPDC087697]|uniref:hypothetical protein n=1 Tax=Pseudomonas sp. NPDC087697 TaxID=3364447 RepID=UPI00382E8376
MRILIAIAAFVLISGCMTSPISAEKAARVPSDRVFAFQQPIEGDSGTIFVTRDGGLLGSACYIGIYVNGDFVARMGPGEGARFFTKPGEVFVGAGEDLKGNGLCSIGISLREVVTTMDAGEVKRFRIYGDASEGISIAPSSR